MHMIPVVIVVDDAGSHWILRRTRRRKLNEVSRHLPQREEKHTRFIMMLLITVKTLCKKK
jgi:hypothetical protein